MLVIREGKQPVVVRTGDEPFQVCLMGFFLVWGAVSLLALSKISGSSSRIIPAWGVYVFFACLVIGCALTLIGVGIVRFRENLVGLDIERAALIGLVGLLLCYSLWTFAAAGPRAMGFVLIVGGVWTAAIWRVLRITADLRRVDEDRAS